MLAQPARPNEDEGEAHADDGGGGPDDSKDMHMDDAS